MSKGCYPLRKKLALGGQLTNPYGGGVPNEIPNPYVDPLAEKNKKIEQTGISAVSSYGPWWGVLAQIGTAGSKKIGGDNTNYFRGGLAQVADPGNPFKGSGKETGKGTMGGNFLKNIILGKNAWDAVTGRNAAFARKYKADQQAAQQKALSAQRTLIGRANFTATNNAFAGDQSGMLKPQFAEGGQIAHPKIIQGGHFKPVAGRVLQVKAHKPGKDQVETPDAMLDDGEIVDKKGQVFSNRIAHPAGGTIATKAKKAAQQGQSLDPLFNLQESLKSTNMPSHSTAYQKSSALTLGPVGKKVLADGGQMDPGPKTRMGLKIKMKNPVKENLLPRGGATVGTIQSGTTNSKTGKTTMGEKLPFKSTPISQDEFFNGPGKATQRIPKIKNFTRSGYR